MSAHPTVRAGRLPGLALVVAALVISNQAMAGRASEALANCRAGVGRPVVRDCIRQRIRTQGGMPSQHVAACREIASPAVKGCLQAAMADVIAECRKAVGRPIVESCVTQRVQDEDRFRFEHIASCRTTAVGAVKACVWRDSATAD